MLKTQNVSRFLCRFPHSPQKEIYEKKRIRILTWVLIKTTFLLHKITEPSTKPQNEEKSKRSREKFNKSALFALCVVLRLAHFYHGSHSNENVSILHSRERKKRRQGEWSSFMEINSFFLFYTHLVHLFHLHRMKKRIPIKAYRMRYTMSWWELDTLGRSSRRWLSVNMQCSCFFLACSLLTIVIDFSTLSSFTANSI